MLYQIYVRSFADSNGDGIGDLPGLIGRLDDLAWLGVDGVWLSPITDSPNEDWGYDVSDYRAVHPDLGTLGDVDRLIDEAGRRGIRVILDLVPNHTSDRHPWFHESRSSRASRYRDWYVWADPKADGSPPNNWISNFGGPAWTLDPETGQYYLHNFLPSQPDLDWWNAEVRHAFDEISSFWFARGVAGFRIDVCHMIVKDRELRDNPPAVERDSPVFQLLGQRQLYNADRPEVHEVLRRWRRVADRYDPPRLLLGETYLFDLDRVASYYGRGDELDLAFNIPFVYCSFAADRLRSLVEKTESTLPPHAWPVWTGSNHDAGRFTTRWCGNDAAKIRCALVMLLGLRGTPVLYCGDEIGMPETRLEYEDLRDPVGRRHWPVSPGRDPGRTPMHWSGGPGAGFTVPEARPWLPIGDRRSTNVEDQRREPGSVLHFCRRLIALRRSEPDLRSGGYASLDTPPGVWAWRRGRSHAIAMNLSGDAVRLAQLSGRIVLDTRSEHEEAFVRGVSLDPYQAIILEE